MPAQERVRFYPFSRNKSTRQPAETTDKSEGIPLLLFRRCHISPLLVSGVTKYVSIDKSLYTRLLPELAWFYFIEYLQLSPR